MRNLLFRGRRQARELCIYAENTNGYRRRGYRNRDGQS